GCSVDPYLADPSGKVALIVRGECTFQEKYQRAANAGAVGVLIHNQLPGLFAGGGVTSRGIFGVGISKADGLHIRSQSAPTLTWTSNRINAANPTGGLISSFSSYGLSPDLALKPDIGAPGGLIRSTWPLEQGGYATISGTSMSSPHVAGGVALLLEARPRTSSNAVRGILQNTASPKNWWGNPGLGFLDNVHRQGAGMLQIDDAIQATTSIAPSKLSLGESQAGPATRTVTITNTSGSDVTYTLSHRPALSTRPSTFAPTATTGFASVAFSAPSLLVPAGGSATVDVTITANAGLANRSQYGGYLVATGSDGSVTRVPYAGLKGDYQSFTVLAPTANGFPWLARRTGASFTKVPPASATFTMAGAANLPQLLVHLDHQSRRLRVEINDAASGRSWHRAFDFAYLPRNAAASGFFALAWDGRTTAGNKTYTVPDGTYVMKLSVLKALGDEANPAHWETWTSPAFTIDRP
ncbi:MAG: S8 family serine peptidase, partial [Chloroflexota bacterium]